MIGKSELTLTGEASMVAFGRMLAEATGGYGTVYLEGNLGAGKTTLCRGVLRGFGYEGAVKSPTYTLVEPYEMDHVSVYHFDLYRLGDPEELDFLGVRDYLESRSLCLIEWPERGRGFLPPADIIFSIDYIPDARHITLESCTAHGVDIRKKLAGKRGDWTDIVC